jgi:phosphoenolpyruvate carboxykinase (ATP)
MYHFLSGYTAKVAGTELGVTEPQATFSACFGDPFLPLHPTKYADLLLKKFEKHGTQVYLINTGWTGGSYGVGKRMSIKNTRACIDAILDGGITNAEFRVDDRFGFEVPLQLPGVETRVLHPRDTWENQDQYYETADKLAAMFKKNFGANFVAASHTDYSSFGPK